MGKLTVTFKTITPLFLGGAEPDQKAELRAPPIKAAMRFWYRAVDPEYKKHEHEIFGGTEHGQGVFSMRLKNDKHAINGLNGFMKHRYNLFTSGSGKNSRNGMIYLGFPLETGNPDRGNHKQRKFINVGEIIEFELIFRKDPDEKISKGILASLWLLGHIGGLGSRARRGFGTVALQTWSCQWDEASPLPIAHEAGSAEKKSKVLEKMLSLLPIAHEAGSAERWLEIFQKGKEILKGWFQEQNSFTVDHTSLSKNTKFYLFQTGETKKEETKIIYNRSESKPFHTWEWAMRVAGLTMQSFRQRWKLSDTNSDYHRVKGHLGFIDRKAAAKWGITACKILDSPQRVAFGLPLAFQSSYQDGLKKNGQQKYTTVSITFEGEEHQRNASPIQIRIINIAGKCHPLYIRLDAPFLKDNEKVKDEHGVYTKQNTQILDDFWNDMKRTSGHEGTW